MIQSGPVTRGHGVVAIQGGAPGSAVFGDAGSALDGKFTELGITAPGTPLCINDSLRTGAYHELCFGANALGGGLLSYNAYGGAAPLPLNCNINGQFVPSCLNPGQAVPAVTACINILAHGGSGDGTTDNVPAWLASRSQGRCIYFPPGTYSFSSQITYTLGANDLALTLYGDGGDLAILKWPAGGGLKIIGTANETAFHIRDLTFVTGTANTGVGIDADWGTQHNNNMASSTLDRVRVSGDVIGGPHYWATGIRLNGVSQVNFNSIEVYGQSNGNPSQGDCLRLEAPGSNASFIYNISNTNFLGCLHGLNYGGSAQGVAITNTNFVLNQNGIYVGPDTGGAQAQLSVVNSQFDNQGDNVLVDTGSNLSHLVFTNNVFYIQPNTAGIHIKAGGDNQINGNNFGPTAPFNLNGAVGVLAENTGINIADGNQCITMSTCIHLTSTANGWRVSNTWTNAAVGSTIVVNDAAENATVITGLLQRPHQGFPNVLAISAAASQAGPSGLIVLTTVQTTAELVVGQLVMLTAPGLSNQPAIYKIAQIPDAHTVILAGSSYGGALTGNGALTAMP